MSEFFIGQIMMTGFGFAQKYFAQCNGQLLPIAQNQALFSLLGVAYGGDGVTTFALPDLRSRTPAGGGFSSSDPAWQPSPYATGEAAGSETVTLLTPNMPAHTHAPIATSAAATASFGGPTLTLAAVQPSAASLYTPGFGNDVLDPQTVSFAGGTQPHPNLQPYETINFNIALSGIFPPRS